MERGDLIGKNANIMKVVLCGVEISCFGGLQDGASFAGQVARVGVLLRFGARDGALLS